MSFAGIFRGASAPTHRAECILAAIVLPLGAAGRVDAQDLERIVPSEFCGNYVFIDFELHDSADARLRLVVDSGASHTIVDPDSIERISGRRVNEGRTARFRGLEAGPLRFTKLRARVRELDHIAEAFGDPDLDGILGFPAFRDVLLTIDYPAQELRISEGRLPKPDRRTIFKYSGKKRPHLTTRVQGRKVRLLLDTGSNDPLCLSESRELDWAHEPIHLSSAVRIDRVEQRFVGRLAGEVAFGSVTFDQPLVEQTDRTELVGTGLLEHFVLTFDQRKRRIRMLPASGPRVRLDALEHTGVVLGTHPRGRRIVHLVPGSPAEAAGLRIDDIIMQFNGLDPLTEGCTLRNLSQVDTEAVSYILERDGERLEVVVPMAELIP